MDIFGTFAALNHGWRMYLHEKREDGRTCAMLECMADGDTFITIDRPRAERMNMLSRKSGKNITVKIVPAHLSTEEIKQRVSYPHCCGTVYFDHNWIECWIASKLFNLEQEFCGITTAASYKNGRD